jgi:hypothetical protein
MSPPRKKALTPAARRAQELLGLFTYHRDAPLVARALGVSLADLTEELERLKIRRRAFALTRGSDHELPRASAVAGAKSGPPVRRRPKAEQRSLPQAKAAPAAESGRDRQASELKALLAEVGPRRTLLAARLGSAAAPLSDAALLARFRAAGLERELALRERDLIRALWTKLRCSEVRVATELSTTPEELRRIARERGLARDLDALRDRFRRDARHKKWPEERLDQVLHRRDELRDLGLLEELESEVRARAVVIWTSLHGKAAALDLFAKKLHLTREEARKLQALLNLQ